MITDTIHESKSNSAALDATAGCDTVEAFANLDKMKSTRTQEGVGGISMSPLHSPLPP